MKCMLVKENPEDAYEMFYDRIAGFEYEEGYTYELRVSVETIANPPADASSLRYTLIEQVSVTPSLEGRLWVLVRGLDQEGQLADVLDGTEITAEFREGRVAGSAGCNQYFGEYTLDGTTLTTSGFGVTMMLCGTPEGVMEQEQATLAALEKAASYTVTEDRLEILDESGSPVLVYEPLLPAPLVGTHWIVQSYNNGTGGMTSALLDTQLTAFFAPAGGVSGSAGCNLYKASVEVSEDRIAFGPAVVTRKMCGQPEGIMEQEQAFLAALGSAATYEIRGDRLEMLDAEGTRAVILTVAD
jgi:heat shock protein HslJ